ncbi:MAG: hypothetical protein LDL41_23805 [Coleofasciculus sp. S288]|nr:hypothetical protein [Coleofasciculus sp. S288]
MSQSMKTAFLILGAQRSGTSVTSHLLSQFGVDFGNPNHFIQFEHNPIFFELKWVNEYNNKLINALGYSYTDFFLPLEEDFAKANTSDLEKELQDHIKKEWDNKPLIGLKDPRIGLTFPIWEKILSANHYQLNIILAFRHPFNFLKSNQKLFHNWKGWTDTRHFNFWLQLNLTAIYFTRHFSIYYLNYDHLMTNPLEEAQTLASFFYLDSELVTQASLVVNPSYYHHQEVAETGNPFVDNCYKLLCSHALYPADYLNYRTLTLTKDWEM